MARTNRNDLKKKDFLTVKDRSSGYISKVIAPNGLQVGMGDGEFRSDLVVKGSIKGAFSGSLTHLQDGTSYIIAGSNITVTTGSTGALTIASTGTSVGTLTNKLWPGSSIELASDSDFTTPLTYFNGDATTYFRVKLDGSTIDRGASGLSVGSVPYSLTWGDGIVAGAAISFDGSAAVELTVNTGGATSGLNFTGAGVIYVDPTQLTATTATPDGTNDYIVMYDNSASATRKITVDNFAAAFSGGFSGTTTYSLTDGNGITDFTFDGGTDSITVSVEAADSTVSISSSGIAVASVPNALTHGDGIASLSYDGSSATSVTVSLDSDGGLSFDGSGGVKLEISNLITTDIVMADYLPFYDYGEGTAAVRKVAVSDFASLIAATLVFTDTDWVDKGSSLVSTSSVSIAGGLGENYQASSAGTDIYFFVSGSVDSLGGATQGAALFGGDVKIKGSLVVDTDTIVVMPTTNRVGIGQSSPSHTLDVDGNIGLTVNSYVNFGSTDGSSGYGIKDDSGTIQFKNSAGSWADIGDITAVTAGTGLSGGGSDGTVSLSVDNSIVATLTGSQFSSGIGVTGSFGVIGSTIIGLYSTNTHQFTGSVGFKNGLSGSLTNLADGTSYLVAGAGIAIVSASNGAVTITNDGSVGDITAVTAGTGLTGGGTSGDVTLNIDNSVVATLSGSRFSGGVTLDSTLDVAGSLSAVSGNKFGNALSDLQQFTGSAEFKNGLSGSLTHLPDGTSYIIAGTNVSIASASNGGITISAIAGGGGIADGNAEYLVLSATASLSQERVFNPSTGLKYTDGGAGGNYTLVVDDSIVATLSGSTFSGVAKFSSGLSGSLTKLTDGSSYLVAGAGISVSSASNGQVTITGNVGDITGVTAGTGLTGGGTSGNVTLNIDNSIVATLSGSQFSGNVGITGSLGATAGLSGSLTKLTDGTSYMIAGSNVTVTSASNGAITLASTNTTYTAGDGLDLSGTEFSADLKSSGGLKIDSTELAIDDSIVATVSGSTFTGAVKFNNGLSGSLTHLADGTPYIVAGSGISVASASSGQITITGNVGDITGVTAGTGLTGGGTSGTVTLNIDNSIVATLTGSQFSGNVGITGSLGVTSGLSGSLTHLTDGTSYLVAGNNIQISTGSSGAVTITGTSTGDITSVVAGTGLTGGGASGDVTLNIDDSVTATLSGSQFSGNVGITGSLGVTQAITSTAISGSLTHLSDGTSYLVAGNNIQIATGSSGAITITGTGAGDITSIVAGTGLTGGGSSGDVTLNVDNSVVATLTGSQFSGNVGITGSLEVMTGDFRVESTGEDQAIFLDASANTLYVNKGATGFTTVIKNTNNEVFRAGAGGAIFNEYGNKFIDFRIESWNKPYALYIDSQNDQVLILSGGGATSSDESTYADINFFVSGSIGSQGTSTKGTSLFGGDVINSGSLTSVMGLSGSLTQLADGTSYMRAGNNITVTSASNGAITITSTGGGGAGDGDSAATYLVLSATSSLSNERVFTSGLGIQTIDAGAGGAYTVKVKNNIVATLTGSQFSGNVGITGSLGVVGGISGSLTQLTDGTSYLKAGTNINIASASNGAVTITASGVAPGAGGSDTQVQFNDSDALNGNANFTFDKTTSALSVTNLSGSLTKLTDGTSYIRAGNGISVTSGSSGYITVTSAPTGFIYELTGSHAENQPLIISGIDFTKNEFNPAKTDLYLNGVLLLSGSLKDYELNSTSNEVIFKFGLQNNDALVIKFI